MPEMVDFVKDVMGNNNIHFEPATACNRAGESMIPSAADYVKYFKLAKARGEQIGVTVFTSMQRPDNLSQTFCGTANAGMTLLADGTMTACSRVTHPEDPFINKYVFGKYNAAIGTFEFYPEKITDLRTQNVVTAYPECNDCFARWHCSGICPANRDRGSAEYLCEITQSLTFDALIAKYKLGKFQNQQEAVKRAKDLADKLNAQTVQPNPQAPMNASENTQQ